jgi:hypothetical protein
LFNPEFHPVAIRYTRYALIPHTLCVLSASDGRMVESVSI